MGRCGRIRGGEGGSERQSGEEGSCGAWGRRGHGWQRDGEDGTDVSKHGGGPVVGVGEGAGDRGE